MARGATEIDVRDLDLGATIRVRFVGIRRLTARLVLSGLLLRMAAWLSPIRIVFEPDAPEDGDGLSVDADRAA